MRKISPGVPSPSLKVSFTLNSFSLSPPLYLLSSLIKKYASNGKQQSQEQKVNKSSQACKCICNSVINEIKEKKTTLFLKHSLRGKKSQKNN